MEHWLLWALLLSTVLAKIGLLEVVIKAIITSLPSLSGYHSSWAAAPSLPQLLVSGSRGEGGGPRWALLARNRG